jgi:glycosyltransferase involved in cell wall biosynthesis
MRILQISTHTTLRPRHGGQLRSHNIARVVEAAGHELQRLAVAYKHAEDPIDPREPIVDISRSKYWWRMIKHGPMELNDYFSLQAVIEEPALAGQVSTVIDATDPDVIMLEHPWMWPLIKKREAVASGRIHVIYNSQNVEADLKHRILTEAGHSQFDELLQQVMKLEEDLVQSAAATTVCTAADGDVFTRWGARRIVVANNGAVRREYGRLMGILPSALVPDNKYAFAVGSNHPPNLAGLQNYVAPALKYLRPLQRIVVAGGVCEPFRHWLEQQGMLPVMADRLVLLGAVDEIELNSAIANASVLLLPIPYGGGSNVKTAEALLSRKRIIATDAAMRGFSEFSSLPMVKVIDSERSFVEALLESFDAGPGQDGDADLLNTLLWDNTLAPIAALLAEWTIDQPTPLANRRG